MFKIDSKQNIYITRGDDAAIELTLNEPIPPYNTYILQDGDEVVFTVSKAIKEDQSDFVLQKIFTGNTLIIRSFDTQDLEYGEYVYDIQVIFKNGLINTVVPYTVGHCTKFYIMGEVT